MNNKPMMSGYAKGGLAMVKKGGKMVPAFAADNKGKMKNGGAVKARQTAMSKGKAC
jgi:hypothetical protein